MNWRQNLSSFVRRIQQQQSLGVVIGIFLVLLILEMIQLPQMQVFLVIEENLLRWLSKDTWEEITWLGDFRVLICLLAPLLVIRPRALVALLIATPLASLSSVTLKTIFNVRRPYEVLHPLDTDLLQAASNSSFPSGHSLTVAAVGAVVFAFFIAPRPKDKWRRLERIALTTLIASVMLSRMALQAHWPLDVLSGFCIGWIVGSIACVVIHPTSLELPQRIHQYCSAILLSLASVSLCYQAPTAMPERVIPLIAAASIWIFGIGYLLVQFNKPTHQSS